MPRSLTLTPHLTAAERFDRYRHSTDPVVRSHFHLLWPDLAITAEKLVGTIPAAAALTG